MKHQRTRVIAGRARARQPAVRGRRQSLSLNQTRVRDRQRDCAERTMNVETRCSAVVLSLTICMLGGAGIVGTRARCVLFAHGSRIARAVTGLASNLCMEIPIDGVGRAWALAASRSGRSRGNGYAFSSLQSCSPRSASSNDRLTACASPAAGSGSVGSRCCRTMTVGSIAGGRRRQVRFGVFRGSVVHAN